MERSSRGYGPNIPGQVPAGPSAPLLYNTTAVPLSTHLQSPMPNFKIKIANSSHSSAGSVDGFNFGAPPQKRRRIDGQTADAYSHPSKQARPPPPPRAVSSATGRRKSEDGSYLPFPGRRPRSTKTDVLSRRAPPRMTLTNDSIVYGPAASTEEATRYSDGLADFASWNGNHPEDTLSDTGIRCGYFDKVPNLLVELASGRPSMLSALKTSGTVEALASLVGSCLARRAEMATVVSHSAFKPPPRVTLTDTRREAWLKELACESVPLRRLSKTIPHGIRGKPLLDQCLAKAVPVWRAIWLIKCVGSNEIRAFRRRGACSQTHGTSGEIKWVREWTESVVETLAATVQDPARRKQAEVWQQKLMYVLALARRLYEEELVDKDVFQAGIIQAFDAAKSPDAMVAWMAILTPYASDALKYCHRGRQLLHALLEKCRLLDAPGTDARLSVLTVKCTKLATDILRRTPQCAILAKDWPPLRDFLGKLSDEEQAGLDGCIDRIDLQNSLVDHQTKLAVDRRFPNPSAAVVSLCDERVQPFDPSKVLSSCQKLLPDETLLADTLIRWAISPCRPGLRSIYTAARLLRMLHKGGHDPQEQILGFLDSIEEADGESSRRLCRLVTELVRSKHFSVSKYLQRRMVRGVSTIKKEQLEILAFLPPQAIPPEVANLASSLCQHAGCSYMVTPTEIQIAASKLDGLFLKSGPSSGFAADAHAFITSLAPNMRHALALHMRKEIVARRDQQAYPSPDDHRMDVDSSPLYAPAASIITVLELVEDLSLFADVLLLIIPGAGADTLRTIVRCAVCHHDAFQAMGAAELVAKAIMRQYGSLYQQEVRDKDLILALIDLMHAVSSVERTFTILKGHLSAIQAEHAGIAPSPVSDQMVDVLQSSEVRNLADLENILQSGNVLDETVLQKALKYLFRVMMGNTRDTEQVVNALKILSCVRNLNGDAFNRLLNQWLEQIFQSDDLRIACQIVPWLIAGDLIGITEVVKLGKERMASNKKKAVAAGLALSIFVATLKSPGPEFLNSMEHYYRLKAAQNSFITSEPALLTSLVGLVLEAGKSTNESVAKRAKQLSHSSIFETIFLSTLCASSAGSSQLVQELSRFKDHDLSLGHLLTRILKCEDTKDELGTFRDRSARFVMEKLARKVDSMNLVPCQLLARLQLSSIRAANAADPGSAFKDAAEIMLSPDSCWLQLLTSWNQLLAGVDVGFIVALHGAALANLNDHISRSSDDFKAAGREFDETVSVQHLSVLEATQVHLTQQQNTDAFEQVHRALANITAIVENDGMTTGALPSIENSLSSVSRVAGLHLRHPHANSVPQDKILTLCVMLAKCLSAVIEARLPSAAPHGLALQAPICSTEAVLETILIHASALLSDEMRTRCLGHVHAQTHPVTPRVDHLLGKDDPRSAVGHYLLMTNETVNSPNSPALTDTQSTGTPDTVMHESTNLEASRRPFVVDPWETLQDATASSGPDDACIDLALFGTQRLVI